MANNNNNSNEPSSLAIARRISGYALDRLTITEPVSSVGLGTAAVGFLAACEGSLYLQPHHDAPRSFVTKFRFITRYAAYNIIPSLIWATQSPTIVVESSNFLSKHMKPIHSWLYPLLPPQRAPWLKILCALRGAVAGSIVLSNVIVLTSLWQRANQDYANRIRMGREPPLVVSQHDTCRPIRLAGVRSNVTELSLQRHGPHQLWPVYENPSLVQALVSKYSKHDSVPMFWQVNDCQYSKASSWEGMKVPTSWLFSVKGDKLLYLEADATCGDASALSLQQFGNASLARSDENNHASRRWNWDAFRHGNGRNALDLFGLGRNTHYSNLDLDLKEVAQGFRQLKHLAEQSTTSRINVRRVLLVDPTILLSSGGGRQTTVRHRVEELELADIVVDARASVLHAILAWLEESSPQAPNDKKKKVFSLPLRPVILETPSQLWFQSIRDELRKHGYHVMDRSDVSSTTTAPMLVYERSSADTVNTIRQYLERGIIKDQVCALVTCPDGLEEVKALNKELVAKQQHQVGCVCSSDIHDRALEHVKAKTLAGMSAETIQNELDAGIAWCT